MDHACTRSLQLKQRLHRCNALVEPAVIMILQQRLIANHNHGMIDLYAYQTLPVPT